MVASADFSLSRIQVAAFLVGDEMRPSQALRHILASLPDVYDGETVSLPLAADAPPDLPSVILSNRERTEELQIARTRVVITWIAPDEDQPQVLSILEVLGTRLADVLEGTQVAAGRLGIIATRSTAIAQPGRVLAQHFCQERWQQGPLNRPEGFEIHAHKVFDLLPDLRVNSWMRAKTARAAGGPSYDHIVAEQDINTLGEEYETRRFTRSQIMTIFQSAGREFDVILDLYFPPEG